MKHEVQRGLKKLRQQGRFQIELSAEASNFVQSLEDGARFRYYETSYYSDGIDLLKLDRTVWEIRRYCQPLDYDFEVDGRVINQLDLNLQRIKTSQEAGDKGTCISTGWLEDLIRKPNHSARKALIWQNAYFGTSSRTKVKMQNYFEAGNSPLFLRPEIIDEVAKYIRLPKDVKQAYRELCIQRDAGHRPA